ncbi:MAG TPA: DUF3108 domain-containing protein [Anaeromyxobacter sp.]|nr:DUF3108 domain-containing protein [Anaeromyxobacter sp.]
MTLVPLFLATVLGASHPAPYSSGEQMRFGINFLGMRMGTAQIAVGDEAEGLVPLDLEAHTTGVAGAFYGFREKLTSRVDPETGLPRLFVIDTHERNWKHLDTTEYRRDAGKAVVIEQGKTTSRTEVPIEPDTLDFVALVFQLRRLPLEPGLRHVFSVVSGTEHPHQVIAEVMDRQVITTRAGTFATLKVRVPTGFTGKFSERSPTYLWLSDDVRRVVVRIATDFSFGGAVAELLSYRPGGEAPSSTAESQGAAPGEGAAQ